MTEVEGARCLTHEAIAVGTCRHCQAALCSTCATSDREGQPSCARCRERVEAERPLGGWPLLAVPFLVAAPVRFFVSFGEAFSHLRDDSLTLLEGTGAGWMAPAAWLVVGNGVLAALALSTLRAFFARQRSTLPRASLTFAAWAGIEAVAALLRRAIELEATAAERTSLVVALVFGLGWAIAFWLGARPRETFTR